MDSPVDPQGRPPTKTCAWCSAPVFWVVMVPSGKKNPIDPEPVPNGNIVLEQHRTGLAKALKRDELYEGPRYISHWATCPEAPKHRAKARPHSGSPPA